MSCNINKFNFRCVTLRGIKYLFASSETEKDRVFIFSLNNRIPLSSGPFLDRAYKSNQEISL